MPSGHVKRIRELEAAIEEAWHGLFMVQMINCKTTKEEKIKKTMMILREAMKEEE